MCLFYNEFYLRICCIDYITFHLTIDTFFKLMEYTDYLESKESKKYHHRIHEFIRYNINEIISDSILLYYN